MNDKDKKCMVCEKKINSENVKRIYGKFSSVYNNGFCSAYCFTRNKLKKENK